MTHTASAGKHGMDTLDPKAYIYGRYGTRETLRTLLPGTLNERGARSSPAGLIFVSMTWRRSIGCRFCFEEAISQRSLTLPHRPQAKIASALAAAHN